MPKRLINIRGQERPEKPKPVERDPKLPEKGLVVGDLVTAQMGDALNGIYEVSGLRVNSTRGVMVGVSSVDIDEGAVYVDHEVIGGLPYSARIRDEIRLNIQVEVIGEFPEEARARLADGRRLSEALNRYLNGELDGI